MKIHREIGSIHLVLQCDKEGYFRPVYEIEVDEAEPIRHGHWKDCGNMLECSGCGVVILKRSPGKWKYCPNCGMKMEERNE